MFRADLLQAATFKDAIEALKDAFPDGKFICAKDGISADMMCPAHILFACIHWHASAFHQYVHSHDLALHFSITQMAKVLKLASPMDRLSLQAGTPPPLKRTNKQPVDASKKKTKNESTTTTTVVEQNPDKLALSIASVDGKKQIEVEFHLMDVDEEGLKVPACEFECNVTMPSIQFKEIIFQLKDLGEVCEIEVTKSRIIFSTSNETNGKISAGLNGEDVLLDPKAEIQIYCKKPIKLQFAMGQLVHMTKAYTFSSSVQIRLLSDYPLCIHYEKKDVGYMTYYLAPKMMNEEDEEAAKQLLEEEE